MGIGDLAQSPIPIGNIILYVKLINNLKKLINNFNLNIDILLIKYKI